MKILHAKTKTQRNQISKGFKKEELENPTISLEFMNLAWMMMMTGMNCDCEVK